MITSFVSFPGKQAAQGQWSISLQYSGYGCKEYKWRRSGEAKERVEEVEKSELKCSEVLRWPGECHQNHSTDMQDNYSQGCPIQTKQLVLLKRMNLCCTWLNTWSTERECDGMRCNSLFQEPICQQRHCILLLTGLDHCSYENRVRPGSPIAPLAFSYLWHMFICVSLTCGSCCARREATSFDPERQRERRPRGIDALKRKEVLELDFYQPNAVSNICVVRLVAWGCVITLRHLHMKRGNGGWLVDVASLRVSVVDWHRGMEGGKELWSSCGAEEKRKKHWFKLCRTL